MQVDRFRKRIHVRLLEGADGHKVVVQVFAEHAELDFEIRIRTFLLVRGEKFLYDQVDFVRSPVEQCVLEMSAIELGITIGVQIRRRLVDDLSIPCRKSDFATADLANLGNPYPVVVFIAGRVLDTKRDRSLLLHGRRIDP